VADHGFSGHRERGLDEVKEQDLANPQSKQIETHEHARRVQTVLIIFGFGNDREG
jgi:hypothetical protein